MNIRRAFALAATLLLSACGSSSTETPPLAGARIGGPFALIDQDGRAVTDRDFAGQYRAIYFGYTYCPDVCPVDAQALAQGKKLFAKADAQRAARVRTLFITVDPARDTPAVLKQFVRAFSPDMVGLTGSETQIAKVARAYGVFYQKADPTPGAAGYLVNHSRQTVLFDPDGKPLALLPTDKGGQAVADELARWVK